MMTWLDAILAYGLVLAAGLWLWHRFAPVWGNRNEQGQRPRGAPPLPGVNAPLPPGRANTPAERTRVAFLSRHRPLSDGKPPRRAESTPTVVRNSEPQPPVAPRE